MIRRAILKAVAVPGYQVPFGGREMPLPYGWGTGGIQVTAAIIGRGRHAEGDRPGRRRHDQRRLASAASSPASPMSPRRPAPRRRPIIQTRHRVPETPLRGGPDPGLPGADPRAAAHARAARDRDAHPARALRVRRHAGQPLREHRPPRPHRQDLQLPGAGERALHDEPLADPEVRQSQARPQSGAAALRRRPREAHLRRAALYAGQEPRLRRPSVRGRELGAMLRALRLARELPRRDDRRRRRQAACSSAPTPTTASGRATSGTRHRAGLCSPHAALTKRFGDRIACRDVELRPVAGRSAGRGGRIRARARPPCSTAWPAGWRRRRARSPTIRRPIGTGRRASPVRGAPPRCSRAPNGASSTRMRATGCAWASAPAPISASG